MRTRGRGRLGLFASATDSLDPDSDLEVPSTHALQLEGALTGSWPCSAFTWSWSRSASTLLGKATTTARTLRDVLTDSAQVDGSSLTERLAGSGFVRKLLPAQVDAVSRLEKLGNGGNFSVPGAGKTTMTLALYALLRAAGIVDRLLVVAPLSAHEAWGEEIKECFDEDARPLAKVRPVTWTRPTEVVVINYERAAATATPARARRWGLGHRVMLVFDEAHRAKRGALGKLGGAATKLTEMAERRFVLTGTPMPNSVDDLAAILDLAWPGHGQRLARIEPSQGTVWVRLTKRDLALDPLTPTRELVTLDDAHRKVYDTVAAQARVLAESGLLDERPEFARQAIMRLLAAATNPATLLDETLAWPRSTSSLPDEIVKSEQELRDRIRMTRPVKLLRAAQIASEHARDGRKLLIWSNFLATVKELERLLAPYGVATITGATPVHDPGAPKDRFRELQRFRNDPGCHVLVATPQTLGEGISLHKACQSQLHVDRSFNAGLYLQALDRTHRVGMPAGTHASARVLIARGTLDENVDASLVRKIQAMMERLDDPSLLPLTLPDEEVETVPDEAEVSAALQALLSHLC